MLATWRDEMVPAICVCFSLVLLAVCVGRLARCLLRFLAPFAVGAGGRSRSAFASLFRAVYELFGGRFG